jgi:hypothetical protein
LFNFVFYSHSCFTLPLSQNAAQLLALLVDYAPSPADLQLDTDSPSTSAPTTPGRPKPAASATAAAAGTAAAGAAGRGDAAPSSLNSTRLDESTDTIGDTSTVMSPTGDNCVLRFITSVESEDDLRRIMMSLTKLLLNPLQATILPNSQKKVNVHEGGEALS